jgi:hypothetical protein
MKAHDNFSHQVVIARLANTDPAIVDILHKIETLGNTAISPLLPMFSVSRERREQMYKELPEQGLDYLTRLEVAARSALAELPGKKKRRKWLCK